MSKVDINEKVASDLQKKQARRELKYANRMLVYGYRVDGHFTPNMILLPKSSESANPLFVMENCRSAVKSGKFKVPNDLCLVRLGEFNLVDGKYTSFFPKVVCDIAAEIKKDVK